MQPSTMNNKHSAQQPSPVAALLRLREGNQRYADHQAQPPGS
jgi:hypothetical protein